jgi:hypothetical protein
METSKPQIRLAAAVATLMLTVVLGFAPAASASRGVAGYFQFNHRFCSSNPCPQDEPGDFGELGPVAVNGSGGGGASPGGLYATDPSTGGFAQNGPRIQQFTTSGSFVRLWGVDVVGSGPDQANEVQAVRVGASGGTFTLGFGGASTVPIPYGASPATVEAALNGLGTLSASVSGGPGDASGSTPYLVTFTGASGGIDQPLLDADGAGLLGKGISVYTTRSGATGFEICEPANGDHCKAGFVPSEANFAADRAKEALAGGLFGMSGLAVDQSSGDLYVAADRRVNRFSATGQFVSAFGQDVVRSGPDDSSVDAQQQLSVAASSGTFTVSYPSSPNLNPASRTTAPLPYNASAAAVETQLNALDTIGGFGGRVTVTGGPGDPAGSSPYLVTFGGTLGGDAVEELTVQEAALTGTATVSEVKRGGAYEICGVEDACKPGADAIAPGGTVAFLAALAIAPPGTANAGNVLVAESPAMRVQEFTAAGAFVRAFGWDVDSSQPSAEFEVCTTAASCRAGASGVGVGQFSAGPESIAEDSAGAIYAADGKRIQKFTPSGSGLTPSLFGTDEVQEATVNATAGQFRLTATHFNGTTGTGTFSAQSNVVTSVVTKTGVFTVGQPFNIGGGGIPDGTTITAVSPGKLTLSNDFSLSCDECNLFSNAFETTADLAHDATAKEVEDALDALPAIASGGGSVSVTGGPSPYEITFDGGSLARSDQPLLAGRSGTVPLSGGSGAGANTVTVSTQVAGGPDDPVDDSAKDVSVAAGPAGKVFVTRNYRAGFAVCADGALSPAETRVQELNASGAVDDVSLPCAKVPPTIGTNEPRPLTANLVTGDPYLVIPNEQLRAYIFGAVGGPPSLTLNPVSNLAAKGATISGTINPNGVDGGGEYPNPLGASYRVEYKRSSESSWTVFAPDVLAGRGTADIPFNVGVSGLSPNTSYDVRVVVTKPFGFAPVVGATQTFTTLAAPPAIDAFFSSDVTAHTADVHALINAQGTPSSFHVEYGRTPEYGQSTPEAEVGASLSSVPVVAHLEDLESAVYHFRVVATSAAGTVKSVDQTFSFYPEPCPNSAVRQQSGSADLPDCRAYELVSPGNAGTVTLRAGGPNSPEASSPPRFAYAGAFGTLPGPWNPPNVTQDLYVSTRTDSGWHSVYVGIPGDQVSEVGGPPSNGSTAPGVIADIGLDKFVDWESGHQTFGGDGPLGSFGGYEWDSSGAGLGRLPTNLTSVPGGELDLSEGGFAGDAMPSPDFSHYFFSSDNTAFAPDGLTSGPGSAYDNDLADGSVTVISKLANGSDIPAEPGNQGNHYLNLPAVSTDGSHVLIAAPTNCAGRFRAYQPCSLRPSHLYMRVNQSVTYDISRGHAVSYEGMTADGSTVYFTTAAQLTGDDHDSSIDLYRWSEAGDSLTRISAGSNGVGDIDACSPTWIAKCGVQVVPTDGGAAQQGQRHSYDSSVAADSGDVYFYSPEQFTGSEGIPGRRNLYAFRGGQIHYVATLDSDKPASRIEVSPDGAHVAFVTTAKLTSYENAGHAEMYTYDPSGDRLDCASCIPGGEPPGHDVLGSENGIFMTDDGRAFFVTSDPLVPRDTDNVRDVYEYVSGRPQLITSGLAATDAANGEQAFVGLSGVSADGVDVYFSAVESLVATDHNGQLLRFYDARTNGGFLLPSISAPCAAADECHGPVAASPPPLGTATSADLGSAGNVTGTHGPVRRKKHRKHRAKHRRIDRAKGRHGAGKR